MQRTGDANDSRRSRNQILFSLLKKLKKHGANFSTLQSEISLFSETFDKILDSEQIKPTLITSVL